MEIRPEERVHLKLTDSIPVHHIEIEIASKTPKQEEDEPDYFPPSETLRQKRSHDTKPMKVINSETVTIDDGKLMNSVDAATTDGDDDKTMNYVHSTPLASENDHTSSPQIYQLMTDAHLPDYTRFIVKTSLLHPVMKEVSPQGGIVLILTQKTDSDIQLMLKILSGETTLTHSVNLMSTFFQKLHKNRKRLENVNGVLYRIFYDHTGLESHKQIVVPAQVMLEIIRSLHSNPVQGHPGSKKMLHELRKRYYSPSLAEKTQKILESCETCMRSKSTNESKIRPPLQKIYDPCNGPSDLMEVDIVGPLPALNGFTHILTAIDVFSRYLFAVPLRKPDTPSVVKALLSVFTKHAYVPTHILTDKGSVFTAELFQQLTKAIGIEISHATVKHAQTIGMVERSHAKLKKILKIHVNVDRPQWDRYVDIAIMAHNTTYHTSLKCSPTEIFHGRTPYNALDLKYSNPERRVDTKFGDVNQILNRMNEIYRNNTDNIVAAYHKYKAYYDRKAKAQPLKVNDLVFLLDPKYDSQGCKEEFKTFHWKGPFKVMKVLSDSNYIIRKVGTFKTQCVHRIRLKIFKPEFPVEDVDISNQPVYADTDRTEDSDNFESHIPTQTKLNSNSAEPETDEETPVERVIRKKPPDYRQTIKHDRPLNRLPNRLSLTPQPEIIIDDLPRNAPQVQSNENDEISPQEIIQDTTKQTEPSTKPDNTERPRQMNDDETPNLIATRTNKSKYSLRENPQPKRYSDFLIHEISTARNALRKTNTTLQ